MEEIPSEVFIILDKNNRPIGVYTKEAAAKEVVDAREGENKWTVCEYVRK